MAWTQKAADTFTGTGGTRLNAHTPDQGSAWVEDTGTWTLNGDSKCDCNISGNGFARNTTSLAAKQRVDAKWINSINSAGLMLRMSSSDDGYLLLFNSGGFQIYVVTAGSGVLLTGPSGTFGGGATDVASFTADGNTLTGFVNGVQQIQTTDSTWATGVSGLFASSGGVNDIYFSEFAAFDDAGFDAATFPHRNDMRPMHYSKLTMVDSGPRPGRGI